MSTDASKSVDAQRQQTDQFSSRMFQQHDKLGELGCEQQQNSRTTGDDNFNYINTNSQLLYHCELKFEFASLYSTTNSALSDMVNYSELIASKMFAQINRLGIVAYKRKMSRQTVLECSSVTRKRSLKLLFEHDHSTIIIIISSPCDSHSVNPDSLATIFPCTSLTMWVSWKALITIENFNILNLQGT